MLPGINNNNSLRTFVSQVFESLKREYYLSFIKRNIQNLDCADPNNKKTFNPLKASVYHYQNGNIDEAYWLIFLSVHFGRHRNSEWHYVREVYKGVDSNYFWTWDHTSNNINDFRSWLNHQIKQIKPTGSRYGFGNHRKYETLDAMSPTGTGAVIESYISWIGPNHDHQEFYKKAINSCNFDPEKSFDFLYSSMEKVTRFGRTARFDYLSLIDYLGILSIRPPKAYLDGATGPLMGAKLLFLGDKKARISTTELEAWINDIDKDLNLGKRVLEDALCNWQKSPDQFKKFRG